VLAAQQPSSSFTVINGLPITVDGAAVEIDRTSFELE